MFYVESLFKKHGWGSCSKLSLLIKRTIGLLLLCVFAAGNLNASPDFKNIIIIAVDTLRADHLSCYGYMLPTSPNIDRFAQDGIRFANCYTLTPLTTPSFSTMLTSLPPFKHGAKRNGLSIFRNTKTFPYYLQRYGYTTAAIISNWPLRKKLAGLHKYFDTYSEVFTKRRYMGLLNSEGIAPAVNEKALEWLEKNQSKRFFLWVHYTDPHAPYIKHDDYTFDYKTIDKGKYPPGTRMKKIRHYDSEIAYTDHYIGKFIEELKRRKLYDDSLIIFLADHGESFGEHNYFKHGRKLYNSTLHVPLIVKLPGNRFKGTVKKENALLMDVAPTIFAQLKMHRSPTFEGLSLLDEDIDLSRRRILMETYGGAVIFRRQSKKYHLRIKPIRFALLKDDIKLIYNLKQGSFEAYHRDEDPFEVQNVYKKETIDWDTLVRTIKTNAEKVNKYISVNKKLHMNGDTLSQQDVDMLKSLGYVD